MAYFAEIDKQGVVKRVIVAEQDFIDSGAVGDPKNWIETCPNTFQGKNVKNGRPFRKNFAGIGHKYDKTRDAFIPEKPGEDFDLDEDKCVWVKRTTK